MSALDDLLGEFESNAGTMPQVNPPEAAKVLATQTAPEVAGEPEPPAQEEAPPAPKPPAPSAAPEGWDSAPKPGPDGKLTTEQLVAELRDRGYNVTLTVGS